MPISKRCGGWAINLSANERAQTNAPLDEKPKGRGRRFTLRQRLLWSYFLLLLVSLGVTAIAITVLFGTQPAPIEQSYQRIAAIVQGLNVRDIINQFNSSEDSNQRLTLGRFISIMDEFAQTRDVRALWLLAQEEGYLVLYDTAGIYQPNARLNLRTDSYVNPVLQRQMLQQSSQIYGVFLDPDGQEWVFGGITRDTPTIVRNRASMLLLAEPRPTRSLQSVLGDFSRSLLPPIIQAALAGGLVAVILAVGISRSIAKPLSALARGAEQVAQGNYDARVPEQGAQEIRLLAQAFNRMADEVRATQQGQRDFLANVSHDLKTPLTSIQGYSQAIIDDAAKDPKQAARIIYEEAGRLNRLVVELTDLIRVQSGRLSMRMNSVDIGAMIHAIVERLMVMAQNKHISLHLMVPDSLLLTGDGDRLAQVVTNLLSNALKYTPQGGKVVISAKTLRDGTEISVMDTGVGIPEDDLPRIFERFYQVDKARGPRRGTGLGLAIVKEIVQAHGGTISAYSAGEGKGSTFSVWLPQPQKHAKASESPVRTHD